MVLFRAKVEETPNKITTTEQTKEYIEEHPAIKSCLKKGVLNYSALARLIGQECNITKKTSKEAILIAARRYKEHLKKEINHEQQIKAVLSQSAIEIKNKIAVFIFEKVISPAVLENIHKKIKQGGEVFYLVEGSISYTIVCPEQSAAYVKQSLGNVVIKEHANLAIVTLSSPKDIEKTSGVIWYLTGLFAEHEVNIIELISCWIDTVFVITAADVSKALRFLKF